MEAMDEHLEQLEAQERAIERLLAKGGRLRERVSRLAVGETFVVIGFGLHVFRVAVADPLGSVARFAVRVNGTNSVIHDYVASTNSLGNLDLEKVIQVHASHICVAVVAWLNRRDWTAQRIATVLHHLPDVEVDRCLRLLEILGLNHESALARLENYRKAP